MAMSRGGSDAINLEDAEAKSAKAMKLTWRADMRWITSRASPPCEMTEVELKRLATLEVLRNLGLAGTLLNPGPRAGVEAITWCLLILACAPMGVNQFDVPSLLLQLNVNVNLTLTHDIVDTYCFTDTHRQ